MEQKRKRYYKEGETIWIKAEKKSGIIKELKVNPDKNEYKALIKTTSKDGDATVVTYKEYNLWEIDKNKKVMYKERNKKFLTVPVRYIDESVEKLKKIPIGDWIDLRSRVDIDIKHMDNALIPLNVAMKLPDGYEAHVLPRSSTYNKWGIVMANSKGIIDNSYSGNDDEWLFNAIALKGDTSIKKGDRICQFKIVPKMDKGKFRFKEVEKLLDENRGGFGTTGSN